MATLSQELFRRKAVVEMEAESGSETEQSELTRSIGLFQLTLFGVGATIGTGIFIVLTQAVPIAGPSVIFSFLIAAVVAGLTAVCYAELAGAVPVSGSSYSYAYATIGELPAMVIAGCLLLEYGVSAAAVAVGWSEYLNELLDNTLGFRIPEALSQAPEQGGIFNLPAVILIALCTLLLIRGASESAKVNTVMVLIKISILILFIVIGLFGWNSNNLADFAPFGAQGITAAAGIIFFSFIGIDAVSTAGEEVKHPHRNMPLAIMFALLIVTTLYILVSLVAVAAQPYTQFEGQEAGLAAILENVVGATWPGTLLAAGAVISIFSVTLVVIYGQTRILFTMARDGMVPELFHRVNPRTRTPVPNTIIVAAVIALLAGLIPINFLAEMTSVGTLVAFAVVSLAVIILRRREPALPRPFKVPGYPVTPILAILGCLWIIKDLRIPTILVFLIWTAVVLAWYFAYGRKHSHLGRHEHVGLIKEEPVGTSEDLADHPLASAVEWYSHSPKDDKRFSAGQYLLNLCGDDLTKDVVAQKWSSEYRSKFHEAIWRAHGEKLTSLQSRGLDLIVTTQPDIGQVDMMNLLIPDVKSTETKTAAQIVHDEMQEIVHGPYVAVGDSTVPN